MIESLPPRKPLRREVRSREAIEPAEDYSVSGAIQGIREQCLHADVACPCGQNAMACGAGQELRVCCKQSSPSKGSARAKNLKCGAAP